jgi:hypothetical protein
MNRFAVIALSIAAVLGTTGGVVLATVNADQNAGPSRPSSDPTDQTPVTSPSATPTPDQTNEPLLYASNRQIHDGAHVIDFSGPTNIARLLRLKTGYLIDESTSRQEPAYQLWVVSTSGETHRIGRLAGLGDLNAEGTEVVGHDYNTNTTVVMTVPAGEVIAKWNQDTDAASYAGFAGADVLISQMFGDPDVLKRWDPLSGRTTQAGQGFLGMQLSPGGSYLVGQVDKSGGDSGKDNCLHLQSTFLKANSVAWDTCGWNADVMLPVFSPDGTRLLVAPPGDSARGVTHLAVIDASDGPSKLVGEFDTPAHTLGAEWGDNGHLYVYGSNATDPNASRSGTWVDRCDLQGACNRVVTSRELLTVGTSS